MSARKLRSRYTRLSSSCVKSSSSLRVPERLMSIAGIDAALGDLAIEHELHVARALELLEDHLVHARARLDQRRRDDRERAALLDVARGAEELLRLLHRLRVQTAGHDLAAVRDHGVVRPREARDRVEQDDDVLPVLHEPLGLLDHHVGDLHVPVGWLVERRADDLGLHVRLHVRDFLRALVDEQHDERDLGMILRDRVGDLLQEDRLARARRSDDQAALSLADRRDEIHDAHAQIAIAGLETQTTIGIARAQIVEGDARLGRSGSSPLIDSTLRSARYRSHSFGGRTWPRTVSPVRRSKRLICDGET